jgi:hypothetical protein
VSESAGFLGEPEWGQEARLRVVVEASEVGRGTDGSGRDNLDVNFKGVLLCINMPSPASRA